MGDMILYYSLKKITLPDNIKKIDIKNDSDFVSEININPIQIKIKFIKKQIL